MSGFDPATLAIENALCDVEDPELGIGIVDLGLVYGVAFDAASGAARVRMTLTSRACPLGAALVDGVRRRLLRVPGVSRVEVEVTHDPPWTPERISPAGRERLG